MKFLPSTINLSVTQFYGLNIHIISIINIKNIFSKNKEAWKRKNTYWIFPRSEPEILVLLIFHTHSFAKSQFHIYIMVLKEIVHFGKSINIPFILF